ncbi:ATP-dependent protease, partial [bacterium]
GITLIYSKDGEPLSPEDFDNLSPDEKETIAKSREILQGKLRETIRAVRETEKNTQALVEELDQKCAMNAVGHELESLFEEFGAYPKVTGYLEALKKDVLEKIDKFRADGREGAPFPLPFLPHSDGVGDTIKRYRVNLLVNNKELSHAPLVIESNPTYHNIVGRIEYRAQYGAFFTDFSAIKAGAFHRANGGALVLNARELLLNPFAYEGMKRILKDQVIRMEEIGEQYRMIATSTLRPEPIAASAKVILMGTPWIFYLLQQYDEDFRKLFKVKGEFAQEMEDTDENRLSYAILVASQCEREGLLPFCSDAVAYVIEEGMRLAEHQKKLDTQFLDLCDLVRESGHWAKKAGKKAVDAEDVKKAQKELKFRNDYHEQYIGSMIKDGSILIDVEGSEVGQLNGLSVYDMGDYAFGKPSRVTARVFLGKEGVVNIEREAELGGHTHNKGVLILQGFFGARYAQRTPLTFGASICFEQSYGGVDGDSASSTELYALISAITDIPLRQDLAVTGSVNQLGQIQSIGGVNLKIEGFYNTCKMKGLTGKQGVVIPASNAQNLMLDEEVVKAVSEGLFHIYTVSTVDEGLEILTGMKAGEPN